MVEQTVYLDGDTLWAGLQQATSRTNSPIFCMLRGPIFKLAIVSDLRLTVSWQTRRKIYEQGEAFFLIPLQVVRSLDADVIRTALMIRMEGNRISLSTGDTGQSYHMQWISDPASLPAPPQFGEMLVPPRNLLEVDYITLSEAVHQSVAKLIAKEAQEMVHRNKLAILVTLQQSQLAIDGREITRERADQYYFDPRLIIRSLEFIKSRQVSLGIARLSPGNRAILSLLGTQDGWTVHCALLSIGLDTQKLYPLPPRQRG